MPIDLTIINDSVEAIYAEPVPIVWLDDPHRKLDAVYDRRYFEADSFDSEVATSMQITSLHCKSDDLEGPKVNERVHVRGKTYRITDARPDGEGWIVLDLELADIS